MINRIRDWFYWRKNPISEQEMWNYLVNRAKKAEARVAELEDALRCFGVNPETLDEP